MFTLDKTIFYKIVFYLINYSYSKNDYVLKTFN